MSEVDDDWVEDDGVSVTEQREVTHELLQDFDKYVSCMGLSNEKHPTAKVFKWDNREWVATGSVSSGATGCTEVWIQRVVPAERYTGPAHRPHVRGPGFYTGLHFWCRKKEYVIEPYELQLFSVKYVKYSQEELFPVSL